MVVFLSDFYAEDRKIFPIVESPDCPDFFPQLEIGDLWLHSCIRFVT